MQTFAEVGIDIPPDQSGQIRVECPRCEGKSKRTLCVNTNLGVWTCKRCGFSGKIDPRPKEQREKATRRRVMQREIDRALIVLAIARSDKAKGVQPTPKDKATIKEAWSTICHAPPDERKMSVIRRPKDISIAVMMAEKEQER